MGAAAAGRPAHLLPTAKWQRLARSLNAIGILTQINRAAIAAYCQAYGRWVEAEKALKTSPPLLRTPAGYVQQSPWLMISNKQMELMARYMAELGLTPSARSPLAVSVPSGPRPLEDDPYDLLAKPGRGTSK